MIGSGVIGIQGVNHLRPLYQTESEAFPMSSGVSSVRVTLDSTNDFDQLAIDAEAGTKAALGR